MLVSSTSSYLDFCYGKLKKLKVFGEILRNNLGLLILCVRNRRNVLFGRIIMQTAKLQASRKCSLIA